MRIGDASEKGLNDYKNIMAKIWKQKTGRTVTQHEKRCLCGFATNVPGEWSVKVFEHALNHWVQTASAIKIAAQSRPNYKPRFYDMPRISAIRSFYKAAVHAYVSHLQQEKKIPLSELNDAASLLALTDPFVGHPGDDTPWDKVKDFPHKEPWRPLPKGGKAAEAAA